MLNVEYAMNSIHRLFTGTENINPLPHGLRRKLGCDIF